MNKVLQKLPALVAEELEAANAEHEQFHSLHEGWAVLREEIEEAHEELDAVEKCMGYLWAAVRYDNIRDARTDASYVEQHAIKLAAEAIQVAAMARKMQAFEKDGDS